MKHINLMNLTFSEIVIFLSAAKFESFSAAAKEVNVTQPTVSKAISSFEDELGVKLFTREKQRVTLTKAGKQLALSLKDFSVYIEHSIKQIQEIDELQSELNICDDRGTDKTLYLYPILNLFNSEHPNVNVNIELNDSTWIFDNVYRGTIDLGFAMLDSLDYYKNFNLQSKVLYRSTWGVFIHKSNPLFYKDKITFEDLADEPITSLSHSASVFYSSTITSMFQKRGLTPFFQSYVSNNASLIYSMYQGKNIVIANEFLFTPDNKEIKYFPLEGTEDGLVLVWKKDTEQIRSFVDSAEKFFKDMYKQRLI